MKSLVFFCSLLCCTETFGSGIFILGKGFERDLSDNESVQQNSPHRELASTNSEILSLLYHSTSPATWTFKTNWLSGTPCPSGGWYGISCSSTDVVAIDVGGNSLIGSLPTELGLLTLTTRLLLDNNLLSGALPSEIGMMSLLSTYFDCSGNAFSQSIPSQLGQFTALVQFFLLDQNSFTGLVPSQLGSINSLRTAFRFDSNLLSGPLPSQLGQLTALSTYFYAQLNSMTGSLPSQLGRLSLMTAFRIDTNYFTSDIPSEFGLMTAMSTLFGFHTNMLSKAIPSQLGQLTNMISNFYLFSNVLSGSIPSQLARLTAMTAQFRLDRNDLTSSIPSQLGRLSLLINQFGLYSNSLSSSIPSQLGQLTALTNGFQLYTNSLSGTVPSELFQMSLLTATFRLNTNSFIGSLPSQVGQLTGITNGLYLYTCSLSGTLPSQLGQLSMLTAFMHLAANSLSGEIPSEFGLLTALQTDLDMWVNSLTGTIPSELGRLSLITYRFSLYQNSLTGSLPSQLGALTGLTSDFRLSANSLSLSLPSELGRLSSVTAFYNLFSNQFCDDVPEEVASLSTTVTASWDIKSFNSLGTDCCIALDGLTCRPTSLPTAVPFPVPTLLPSPPPTIIPTPPPTVMPSLVPTGYCTSGTYFDGYSQCISCAIGSYSNFNGTPFPTSCTLCPAGQYNTQAGLTECINCATGKLSSADRTFCKDCEAGEYNFNNTECVECEYGKYAPSALTGACLDCAAGFYTNNVTSSTSCISCSAGYYSTGSTDECLLCPKGTASSYSAISCTNCTPGYFAESAGSSTCASCAAGKISTQFRASACVQCEAGKHQPATSQSSCEACAPGKYESGTGSLSCSSCTAAYDSEAGATACKLAALYYYRTPPTRQISKACPNNANCAGGNQAPAPNKGHWVDRSSYNYVDNIYTCSRLTCIGAMSNDSCWNYRAYMNNTRLSDECDENLLQCSEGASGPLCGSCEVGYIYRSQLKRCGPCENAKVASFIAMGFVCLFLAIVGGMATGVIPIFPIMKENAVVRFLSSLDSGSLKVIWVTFQIIMSTSWNLDIKYPSPFNELLGALSVLSLDFLALECFQGDVDNRYFVTVYLWSCLPLIVAVLILIVLVCRIMETRFRVGSSWKQSSETAVILNQHIWMLLLLSYLVLPPVAMKQLQSLDCIPFSHDGGSYLRADTGIDCNSSEYDKFRSVVTFLIIIYQSIPIIWMVLLYRQRAALDPMTSNHDPRLALFIRDNNAELASLRFLFNDYNCSKWWFEVAEMYRRIMFVGVLPLVSPVTATRASMGCVLAIASVAYYREERPYRVGFTNFIAHMAQFSILIIFYGALSIDTGVMMDFGLKDLGMGLFLVMTNLSIFGLCVWLGYVRFQRDRRKKILRRGKADQIEQAGLFTPEKFETTFQFMTRASVPISHVLAFHYTSLRLARMARHSGIPALLKYDGVPFSLRQPHLTTNNDRLVFGGTSVISSGGDDFGEGSDVMLDSGFPNDAVVVMALPKHVLDKLPGYEDDECLFRIPSEILKFMKPSSYTAIVDPQPYLNGIVLLPPASIIRCFSLTGDDTATQDSIGLNDAMLESGVSHPALMTSQPRLMTNLFKKQTTSSGMSSFAAPPPSLHQTPRRSNKETEFLSTRWVHEDPQHTKLKFKSRNDVIKIKSMLDYIEGMRNVRKKALEMDLKPLYHFTQSSVLSLIMRNGIRMSTQGQGDGGVYFSTLGPASFDYGSNDYEENIIRTCFGVHRMSEYRGMGKLNAVIVYGCSPLALYQAPGDRDHAKFVPSSLFQDISLPHADGNFFLRPSQILAIFEMDMEKAPTRSDWYVNDLELEKELDQMLDMELKDVDTKMKLNISHVEKGVKLLRPKVELKKEKEDEADLRQSSNSSSFLSFYAPSIASPPPPPPSASSARKSNDIELVSTVSSSPFIQYTTDANSIGNHVTSIPELNDESVADENQTAMPHPSDQEHEATSQRRSVSSWSKTQEILRSKKQQNGAADEGARLASQMSSDEVPKDSSEFSPSIDKHRGFDL